MYAAIARNKRRTYLLIGMFLLIIVGLGYTASLVLGYDAPFVTLTALVVAAIYALIQYFAAAKLAVAMNGAHEIQKKDNPRLYRTVENLSIASGMPMPKIYLIDDPAPNAFATGRDPNHAVVGATTGLVSIMSDTELEAVMAHELGHVKNYDIRVMMIVFGLVAAISFVADMLIRFIWFSDNRNTNPLFLVLGIAAVILAPFVAMLIQLAVSRRREFLADGSGALLTRYPEGLATALEKIGKAGSATRRQNPSTAHLFFANPLKKNFFNGLFSTHPPVEERVARLRKMTL